MKKEYKAPAVLTQMVCTASLMAESLPTISEGVGVNNDDDLLGKERDNGNDGAWTDGLW